MVYFGYFSFAIVPLQLKRQIRLYDVEVPLKTKPDLRTEWLKSFLVFKPITECPHLGTNTNKQTKIGKVKRQGNTDHKDELTLLGAEKYH